MSQSSGSAAAPEKVGRIAQIKQSYAIAKSQYPRIGLTLAGLFLLGLVLVVGLGLLLGARGWGLAFWVITGAMVGLLAVTLVFGRRVEKAAYAQIEGQMGAAAAVLQTLRGGWYVTPAVGVTKNQDIVHRVVGKPGIVLVGEGPSSRVAQLMAVKKKETARWVPDIPIHEIYVGNAPDQVPLGKLNSKVMKLPRVLRAPEVSEVRRKLDAMSATQTAVPLPKGPLPKNARMPRGQR